MSAWTCPDCGASAFFGRAAPDECPFCAGEGASVSQCDCAHAPCRHDAKRFLDESSTLRRDLSAALERAERAERWARRWKAKAWDERRYRDDTEDRIIGRLDRAQESARSKAERAWRAESLAMAAAFEAGQTEGALEDACTRESDLHLLAMEHRALIRQLVEALEPFVCVDRRCDDVGCVGCRAGTALAAAREVVGNSP